MVSYNIYLYFLLAIGQQKFVQAVGQQKMATSAGCWRKRYVYLYIYILINLAFTEFALADNEAEWY